MDEDKQNKDEVNKPESRVVRSGDLIDDSSANKYEIEADSENNASKRFVFRKWQIYSQISDNRRDRIQEVSVERSNTEISAHFDVLRYNEFYDTDGRGGVPGIWESWRFDEQCAIEEYYNVETHTVELTDSTYEYETSLRRSLMTYTCAEFIQIVDEEVNSRLKSIQDEGQS